MLSIGYKSESRYCETEGSNTWWIDKAFRMFPIALGPYLVVRASFNILKLHGYNI